MLAMAGVWQTDAAERISAGKGRPGDRDRPRVIVPVPADPEVYAPRVESGPASAATHRVEADCAPGTWRWLEPARSHLAEMTTATALLIRLERDGDVAETTPDQARRLDGAAERITAAFRIEPRRALPAETAGAAAAEPEVAVVLQQTRERWRRYRADAEAAAAAALAEALDSLGGRPLRLTATVVREAVAADCAPIERCIHGVWTRAEDRARASQRTPVAPVLFGPATIRVDDGSQTRAVAAAAVARLAAWLDEHYLEEGLLGALLAAGYDACEVAAVAGGEREE